MKIVWIWCCLTRGQEEEELEARAAPADVGVNVPDRVALQNGAVLAGACCVVLQVKESGAFDKSFVLFCCISV